MVKASMDRRLDFRRQELRQASRFLEGDYEGINPREFYRHLRRQLEELQRGDDFKYATMADREHDLAIRQEAVGDKTGVVTGRMEAISDWAPIGPASLSYRPWAAIGVLSLLIGGLLTVFGFVSWAFYIVGPVAMLGGIIMFLHEGVSDVPIEQRDTIKTLIEGEVSEKTIQAKEGKRTEMSANMSVIYAGDVFLRVSSHRLSDLPWGLRTELVHTVSDWYNQAIDGQASGTSNPAEEVSTDVLRSLTAWSHLSAHHTAKKLNQLQRRIHRSFKNRQAYADFLNQLLQDRGFRERELSEVMDELEALKGGMDVYVDREGLESTR